MRFVIPNFATKAALSARGPQAIAADAGASLPDAIDATPDGLPRSRDGASADAGGLDAEQRLALIRAALDDGKAEDVLTIDLRGKSSIADYMVIASGRSNRHVVSISERVVERLRDATGVKPRCEGLESGDWALIDALDVVIHVFRPEVREFYALEKMWAPSARAARGRGSDRDGSAGA